MRIFNGKYHKKYQKNLVCIILMIIPSGRVSHNAPAHPYRPSLSLIEMQIIMVLINIIIKKKRFIYFHFNRFAFCFQVFPRVFLLFYLVRNYKTFLVAINFIKIMSVLMSKSDPEKLPIFFRCFQVFNIFISFL